MTNTTSICLHLPLWITALSCGCMSRGSLSSCSLAVDQGSLAEWPIILWQSELVTRCNETWRHLWFYENIGRGFYENIGRGVREGHLSFNILVLFHLWLPLHGFSFCVTSSVIQFYLVPDYFLTDYYLIPDISWAILTRPFVWLFWHLPDRLAPRWWGSLDSSSDFIRRLFRVKSSAWNSYRVTAFTAYVSESKNSNLVR